MSECTTCGAELAPGTTVCSDCGTSVGEGDSGDLQVESAAEERAEQTAPGEEAPAAAPNPTTGPVEAPAAAPPGSEGALARLELLRSGAPTGQVFAIGGDRVVLGMFDPETGPVDVDLAGLPEADYVSRRHAELRRSPDGTWMIEDLGSTNGTFLRSSTETTFKRLPAGDAHPVNNGDEIGLGNARLRFQTGGEEE